MPDASADWEKFETLLKSLPTVQTRFDSLSEELRMAIDDYAELPSDSTTGQ